MIDSAVYWIDQNGDVENVYADRFSWGEGGTMEKSDYWADLSKPCPDKRASGIRKTKIHYVPKL